MECVLNRILNSPGSFVFTSNTGHELNTQLQFGQSLRFVDLDFVLGNLREVAQQIFKGSWINVYATDDDHVVDTSEDSAFEREVRASALTALLGDGFDHVAGFVTEQGSAAA